MIAGEASGDRLGAGLIRAISKAHPDARFEGVAGPQMQAAGCHPLGQSEQLAVMGLVEVLGHLPGLLRLRGRLTRHWIKHPPHVFVGIDAPDFNLGLERRLKRAGIRTVQYVSPQFWAWRPGRVSKMHASVDRVLCLLPFEKQFYQDHAVDAVYVGHPLADHIPMHNSREHARVALGLPVEGELIALLPGSRGGEVRRLGSDFLAAARWLSERRPELRFVAPMANAKVRDLFARAQAAEQASNGGKALALTLLDGHARDALAAGDVVLLASGTATLETMLVKRPMVVAYRLAGLTRWMLDRFSMLKVSRYAIPNLLAGADLVPELMQEQVSGAALGAAVLAQLDDRAGAAHLTQTFTELHEVLRCDADQGAARAVLELIGADPTDTAEAAQ